MNYTHAKRNRQMLPAAQTPAQAQTQEPSMDALRAGLAQPTAEQKGRRVDLPDAMRAKMEASFGADLSAVKLYESEAVADAGAQAVTRGSEIAFAPGMLDFSSFGGQALLGHELSHVVSQSRGEVTGGGFLNDHALEARADREGAMAAAGRQIAMPTAAMSAATAAPAAGPMQAKKLTKEEKAAKKRQKWVREREKKAAKNVDRMYKIMAAKLGGREEDISDKDNSFFDYMETKGNIYAYQEIRKRGAKAADDLVAYRENMQGDDADKLNYESTFSDPALDYEIYNSLAYRMMESPGAAEAVQEHETQLMKAQKEGKLKEFLDKENENGANTAKAVKLIDSSYTVFSNEKRNRYLRELNETDAGRKEHEQREAQKKQRFLDKYFKKSKKKK